MTRRREVGSSSTGNLSLIATVSTVLYSYTYTVACDLFPIVSH